MQNNKLTKTEALELICPVVDNEATEEEIKAFQQYIASDPETRKKYHAMLEVKNMVSDRCPRAKSPESLQVFLKEVKERSELHDSHKADFPSSIEEESPSDVDNPSDRDKINGSFNNNSFLYSAAAAIIFLVATFAFFNFGNTESSEKILDDQVYYHFSKSKGQFIQPTIATTNPASAKVKLNDIYKLAIKIPKIRGAEFRGVVYRDFDTGSKTPMLEYYLPEKNQYAYVFTFRIDDIYNFKSVSEPLDAIKACKTPQDFFVRNVNDKHVVSWKWDGVWYSAISAEDGHAFASRLEELKRDVSTL